MRKNHGRVVASVLVVALVVTLALGCSTSTQVGAPQRDAGEHGEDLHSEGTSEHGEGTGEESGEALGINDVYDTVRNGARLTMVALRISAFT